MISKVICIALLASLVFMFLHIEKIKKDLENKKLEITTLENDLWDATQMEHNIEIVRFADGKYYAVVNIHHAMKSPLFRDITKKNEGDKFVLEYRANQELSAVRIDSISSGVYMLVFPLPEERKDDLSFEIKKIYTNEDYEGNTQTLISEDLFFWPKMQDYILHYDKKSNKVHMGKKLAEQLGYVDDGKGGLIKKD